MVIIRVTEHLHSKMFEFCARVAESRHRSSLLMIVAMLLTSPAPAHAAATQGAPIVEFQFGNPLGFWQFDLLLEHRYQWGAGGLDVEHTDQRHRIRHSVACRF